MDFKNALITVIDKNGYSVFQDTFRVYAIICDFIGSSPYQVKLTNLFFDIQKEDDLFKIFTEKGLKKGREYLKTIYPKYKEKCSISEFKDVVNPISEIVCPIEYGKLNEVNKNKNNGVAIVKFNKTNDNKTHTSIIEGKKVDLLKRIKLEINADKIFVEYGNKFEILKNSKIITNIKAINYKFGELNGRVDYPDSKVTIRIPQQTILDLLDIESKHGDITIDNTMEVSATKLKTEGSVNVRLKGNSAIINTKNNACINGDLNNVVCNSIHGNIITFFMTNNKKKMNINLKTDKGKILMFFGDRLRRRLTKLIGRTRKIQKKEFVGKCNVSFNITTLRGKIKIY